MEPEGSLMFSEKSTVFPYPEPDKPNSLPSDFLILILSVSSHLSLKVNTTKLYAIHVLTWRLFAPLCYNNNNNSNNNNHSNNNNNINNYTPVTTVYLKVRKPATCFGLWFSRHQAVYTN